MELATGVYETSLHATFKHYVKESPVPRCLLMWQKADGNGALGPPVGFKFHYFVKSSGFRWHIDQDRIEDPDKAVDKVFVDPSRGVVNHHIVLKDESGQSWVAPAESFSNSYTAFTLLSQPESRSVHAISA